MYYDRIRNHDQKKKSSVGSDHLQIADLDFPSNLPVLPTPICLMMSTAPDTSTVPAALPKLYLYDCCPYCTRVRIILGLKDVKHELIFVANHDEATPVNLVGSKQVPIWHVPGEKPIAESLDIIKLIDETHGEGVLLKPFSQREELKKWSNASSEVFYKLLLPRIHQAHLPEFTLKDARDHFEKKMSARFGNFQDLIAQTPELLEKANAFLVELEPLFASSQSINEEGFGYDDIDFFSHLRNFTIIKDLVWPQKLRAYVDHVAKQTDIKTLDDFAKF